MTNGEFVMRDFNLFKQEYSNLGCTDCFLQHNEQFSRLPAPNIFFSAVPNGVYYFFTCKYYFPRVIPPVFQSVCTNQDFLNKYTAPTIAWEKKQRTHFLLAHVKLCCANKCSSWAKESLCDILFTTAYFHKTFLPGYAKFH